MLVTTDFEGPDLNDPLILRLGDDAWGPFQFDCSTALPDGVTITDVAAICYDSDQEEIDLIEAETLQVVNDTSIQLKFEIVEDTPVNYYYLKFELTLSNEGTKYLHFGPFYVYT